TATLLMRMLRGRRWYSAHREHLYQWLVRSGRSHAQVVMFYMGWNVLVALPVAWAMNYADWSRNHAAAFGSSESGVWISILGDALPWILAVYGVALVLWIAGRRHCIRSVRRRVGAVHAQ
ncbi:MAG: hypothetical protein ABI650_05185, partial [Dokdonella sp.]